MGEEGRGGSREVSKKGERGKVSERGVGRFLEALLNHSLNNLRFRASVTQFFRTQKDTLVFTYFILIRKDRQTDRHVQKQTNKLERPRKV